MKPKVTLLSLLVLIVGAMVAIAGDKPSDAAIKQKLLGYWQSPRHAYLIKSDGIIYMCPRSICTTTNKWEVKAGLFYWDSEPNEIVLLNAKKFVYRSIAKKELTYTLVRTSEAEAE